MTPQQLKEYLDVLKDGLTPGLSQAWAPLIKQQVLVAYLDIAAAVCAAAFLLGLLSQYGRLSRFLADDTSGDAGPLCFFAILGAAGLLACVVGLSYFAAARLYNPEYFAIMEIARAIQEAGL